MWSLRQEESRGLKRALTVLCHALLDSVLIGLAFSPPGYLSYYHQNIKAWPGKLVRVLGGFAISSIMELKTFFNEMELLLMKNNIALLPEVKPYDTLHDFKRCILLAAKPGCLVPMLIAEPPKGLMSYKKPVMRQYRKTHIPCGSGFQNRLRLRMKAVRQQMKHRIVRL